MGFPLRSSIPTHKFQSNKTLYDRQRKGSGLSLHNKLRSNDTAPRSEQQTQYFLLDRMIPSRSAVHITLLVSAMLLLPTGSFLQPQSHSILTKISTEQQQQQHCYYMTTNDEEEEDDDDDYIDEDSLGDWRSFRMNLANSAASTSSTTSSSTIDGIDLLEESSKTTTTEDLPSSSSSSTTRAESRPKSVSKQNELLLSAQNSALAEEYINGVWAHESSIAEVGGLVCRMPLESEIYRGSPDSFMYNKLQTFLESDEYDRTEDVTSRNNNGRSSSRSNVSQSMSFSALAAKTVFWYRGAEKLLKKEMVKIMSTANTNGRIDPSELDEESLELLQLYMDHQSTWQEVCLVTEMNNNGQGGSKTITINRPMAFKLSKSMARLVLMGAAYQTGENESSSVTAVTRKEKDGQETQNLVKFLSAFENQCAVYVGGPDDMDKPAVLVHGIDDLPGAVEISRGTGIYQGGLEAAIDGVLSGKYKPLDFRFFVGHTRYTKGQLEDAVTKGKYQPIACSRPLVLKQCIQLPKPLWHEVLEFCGGELKEISKLELAKREDMM